VFVLVSYFIFSGFG